ncbi:MAG TPA: alpha/beta hydrolase [Vicinamibacterales bacterium]|jgi:predicted esterase
MSTELGFFHVFRPATDPSAPTLLLLHGTGGDERDMLPIGGIAPGAALLSPRGQVLENGMPRFFRRLAEGVFDEADVRQRAGALARFVFDAAARYRFDAARVVAVGFSNGANIAAAMLLLHPGSLAGAVLFRAMVPIVPDPLPDLRRTHVLISSGRSDPLVAPTETERLAALLRSAGADVSVEWQPAGHQLLPGDFEGARIWLRSFRFT